MTPLVAGGLAIGFALVFWVITDTIALAKQEPRPGFGTFLVCVLFGALIVAGLAYNGGLEALARVAGGG